MGEITDMILSDIAEVITGKAAMNAPRILVGRSDAWGSINVWHVPTIPAIVTVTWEAARCSGASEYTKMTATPAVNEETVWLMAFSALDDWQASRPDEGFVDDSPF